MGTISSQSPPAGKCSTTPAGGKVRPLTFDDYEQVARLEERYGLGRRSYDEWSHIWLGNPAYRDLQGSWVIGWVIEDAGHRIVGSLGSIPLWYEFQGSRILAVTGRALVAEPSYRSACLPLLDRLIHGTDADLYVNNTVGLESAACLEQFRCPRVPVGLWDSGAFWMTRYHGFFLSLIASRNWGAAKMLAYPLAAAALLRDSILNKGLRKSAIEVTACACFDDRFDGFWEDMKRKHPHLLLAVRTREVLEWHFRHAAVHGRLWIAAVVNGPRLAAYAIYERKDTAFKRLRLVDFQSLDGSTALLWPVLSWALERCREEGIDVLEVVGRWLEKGELIRAIAPYRRKLGTWTFVYRAKTPELATSLEDRRAWAPSLFDGDATL